MKRAYQKILVTTTTVLICFSIFLGLVLHNFLPTYGDKIKSIEIIVDAGHGLPDGGAVAKDGTMESDLNLKIAELLHKKLKNSNISVIMTRSDENGIYDDETTIRSKKVADAKKRVSICDDNPKSLVVSIHMNAFSSPSVYGCQVFFQSGSTLSQNLAQVLQQNVNQALQQNKTCKEIPKNVYLFKNISNPAILIECGFLSNANDVSNLKDPVYQDKIAEIIYQSIYKNIEKLKDVQ